MAEIFLYRRDAGINPQQLQKLRRAGFIPVGLEHLSDAKLITVETAVRLLSPDITLQAACRAMLRAGDSTTRYFGEDVARAIIAQGIEAGTGVVHESPVGSADAPSTPPQGDET